MALVGIDFPAVDLLVRTAYETGFHIFWTPVEEVLGIGRGEIGIVGAGPEPESGGVVQGRVVHLMVCTGIIERFRDAAAGMTVVLAVRAELGGVRQFEGVVGIELVGSSGPQGMCQAASRMLGHLVHVVHLSFHRMMREEVDVTSGVAALKVVHEIQVDLGRCIGQCDASVTPGFLLLFVFTADFSLQPSFPGLVSFQHEVDGRTAHVVLWRSAVHHFRFFHTRGRHTF